MIVIGHLHRDNLVYYIICLIVRYESIIAGKPEFFVEYRGKFYTFESEKKLDTFMRLVELI